MTYAAVNRDKCIPLMDNGHCHPTEVVSDKIPALLTFFKEIAREIVRCGSEGRVNVALDCFDASINRISAWTTGYRNFQKALPVVLLQPVDEFKKLQDEQKFSALRVAQEELKTLPFGEIWAEFCKCNDATLDGGRPGGESPTHLANHELKKKLKGGKRQTIPREGFIQLSKDFNIMNTDLLD